MPQKNELLDRPSFRRRLETALVLTLILVLLLSLLPVLSVSRYARAGADDYTYGRDAYHALQAGSGLFAAVARTLKRYYFGWQGSFSAMALMCLTPSIFSEQLYWVTTVVMLAGLILCTVTLMSTLVRRVLKAGWTETLLLALPMLLLSIQTVPVPREAFFWWNGSVYYTFTYSVSLLYVERFVSLFLQPQGAFPWRAVLPGALWALVVGGSNYVSALLCAMLGCCFLLLALCRRRFRLGALVLLLAELVPFLVSALAPGNRVRQAKVNALSPVEAIFRAIAQGKEDLLTWPGWLTLLLCLCWVPLLLRLAGASGFSFRFPAVFAVFTFLFFSAQNTPHFYAASTAGPGRLRDIVYFSHFWLILLNEWYLLGWLRKRVLPRLPRPGRLEKPLAAGAAALLLLLTVSFGVRLSGQTLAAQCVRALTDGSAAAYAREHDQRLAVLLDPAVTDPVFSPLQFRLSLFASGELDADPNNWVNQALALYFGKNTVNLGP